MQTKIIYLAILSYFIGFLFLLLIRSYDKYDREPLWRLVLLSFIGGVISVMVTSFLYTFIHPEYTLTDSILKIGTVEEFSKLLTLFLLYKIFRKEFDEIVDGIIYIAAISLGFSVIENIFYAANSLHPYSVLTQRFLFATIGHISFSVYMGIAFYIHKKIHKNYLGLFLAFLISTLAHGFYDGFIFNKNLNYLFLPLYILLIIYQFRLLKVAYAYSKMKKKWELSNLTGPINTKHYITCSNCGEKKVDTYHFHKVELYICKSCNNMIISSNDFKKLLFFFRPKLNLKTYFKRLNKSPEFVALNQNKTVIYYKKLERINGNFNDLKDWFKQENNKDIKRYHQSLEGKIFKHLGFKYLK